MRVKDAAPRTLPRALRIGDWVQVTRRVTEADFQDEDCFVHAEVGAIAHVHDYAEGGGLLCYFERTGTYADVDPEDLKFLGDANTGR